MLSNMPLIKKAAYFRVGDHKHEFDIWYDSKKMFHVRDFPAHLHEFTSDINTGWYASQQELENAIYSKLNKYYESKNEERKVIIFSVELGKWLTYERTGLGSWTGKRDIPDMFKPAGFSESTDCGLSFEWGIYMEYKGKETKYAEHFTDKHGNVHKQSDTYLINIGDKMQIIDWTPERELFFRDMEKAMNNLGQMFIEFFSNKELMLQAMDNGVKLLK